MEETLTDCLVRVREDLSQLKKVRTYLEANAETEERCTVTWRTIEAFNSILSVCSSQNSPETNALDTLLDSFFYLAKNNADNSVWINFGFELGIICLKILSAIEHTNIFEVLFGKLLSVISIISEHNSNIWKATARQILNVLINKKFNYFYFETILKLYISLLRNINNDALFEFSSQNLHLLKTFSLLIQKIGDFEIQSDIIEVIYLHLSKDIKLISNIFEKENLFQFNDFENDCRMYLNTINKTRRGCDKKVFSICCHVFYLGGCFVEPPTGKNFIWVDANKDTERVSIKCDNSESENNEIIYISFSQILQIQLENEKAEGNLCLTIQTKNPLELQKDVSNICLVTENAEDVYEFVQFLESEIELRKKKKTSKTTECLVINRNKSKMEIQDNAVTSTERPNIDQILPDVFLLFEKSNQNNQQKKTGSQELSPNSFVESLNKHIGLDSPELHHTYEDSIETIEFLQKATPGKSHKLFKTSNEIFSVLEPTETENFIFKQEKENKQFVGQKLKTYSHKPKTVKVNNNSVLNDCKNVKTKLTNSESQDYFRGSSVLKKKPFLPKLKRSKTAKKQMKKPEEDQKTTENRKSEIQEQKKRQKSDLEQNEKPSLLDPNGYAYQRWCKPSTSERSNFWLKKLKTLQKPKNEPENVFDFSEDSDSTLEKNKKKRTKKEKIKMKKETKQTSLRELKEILKKTSPVKEKRSPKNVTTPEGCLHPQESPKGNTTPEIPINRVEICKEGFLHPQESPKGSKTLQCTNNGCGESDSESISSEDEEHQPQNKKRERSEEENSSAKCYIKKKPKISIPKDLLTSLKRRLEITEVKNRRYTEEIIRTIEKATNHLFNHLQKKDGERFVAYLNIAEGISGVFQTKIEDLNQKAKRIQRAILYFKAGCSVSDFCEFLDSHLSKVKKGLKVLKEKKDTQKGVEKVWERLSGLIETEIEKSFKAEWELKRQKLLKCASILQNFEPEI